MRFFISFLTALLFIQPCFGAIETDGITVEKAQLLKDEADVSALVDAFDQNLSALRTKNFTMKRPEEIMENLIPLLRGRIHYQENTKESIQVLRRILFRAALPTLTYGILFVFFSGPILANVSSNDPEMLRNIMGAIGFGMFVKLVYSGRLDFKVVRSLEKQDKLVELFWKKMREAGYLIPEKNQLEWLENYITTLVDQAELYSPGLKAAFEKSKKELRSQIQSMFCENELLGKNKTPIPQE